MPDTPRIAVIGMGCFYPAAPGLRQLWENVLAKRREFRRMPDVRLPLSEYHDADATRPDMTYGTRAAVIDGFRFDWAQRRIPKTAYESTDIVHWLSLEVALRAMEDAGFDRQSIPSDRTGVVVGNTLTGEFTRSNVMRLRWPYVRRSLQAAAKARGMNASAIEALEQTMEVYYKSVFAPVNEDTLAGALSNTIAGRICNFLDLHGGGYTVDGACSSSLIAVATAAQQLEDRQVDLVLAGGVDVSLDSFELIGFAKAGALTREDMNVYDRRGSGFIPGEGCGFVVLKRMEDAVRDGNRVYAVLRGWGLSSDGRGGMTAPSVQGQAKAIARAYQMAGYDPSTLAFIEGHGTGTRVGDRTELLGLASAFSQFSSAPARSCGMTSFKSVVGHTKAAAGVGAFIKTVIGLNRRIAPPTAGCAQPHPSFASEAKVLYPLMQGRRYPAHEKLRAGVSAMGFGGINCHVTLESGDAPDSKLEPVMASERALMVSHQDTEVFLLEAPTSAALLERVVALKATAAGVSVGEMVDLAASLAGRISGEPSRAAVIASTPEELQERLGTVVEQLTRQRLPEGAKWISSTRDVWLSQRVTPARVGVLFPGQGSQRLNMARHLVERFDWARSLLEQAQRAVGEVQGLGLGAHLYRPLEQAEDAATVDGWERGLANTEIAQPAICLASLLWWRFLASLGLAPVVAGGHSLGELTALCAAQVLTSDELFRVAALRGTAMAAPVGKAGTMASLACSAEQAQTFLSDSDGYAVVANLNTPKQTVISGEEAAVKAAVSRAEAAGLQTRLLAVSNAFHSRCVEPAGKRIAKEAELARAPHPKMTVLSGMAGATIDAGMDLNQHLGAQVLAPVDFVGLGRRLASEVDLVLEVGPGRVLSGLMGDLTDTPGPLCLPVESKAGQDRDLSAVFAALFVHGVPLRWEKAYEGRLVRPFVAPEERAFIVNPCERPYPILPKPEPLARHEQSPGLFALQAGLDASEMERYLAQRAGFLADVIAADWKHVTLAPAPAPVPVPESVPTPPSAAPELSAAAVVVSPPAVDPSHLLRTLVAERTGFPTETLTPQLRLLDDLNMDSIKAGELIASAAKACGLTQTLDPGALANATLEELSQVLSTQASTQAMAPPAATTALDVVLMQARRLTGFAAADIHPETHVTRGLALDTEKLARLVRESSAALGIEGMVDLEPLGQRTLGQIAQVLEAIRRQSSVFSQDAALATRADKSWVRDFEEILVEQALPSAEMQALRTTDDWENVRALILRDDSEAEWAEALHLEILGRGGTVQTTSYEIAEQEHRVADARYTHVIGLLPPQPKAADLPSRLLSRVTKLRTLATPPPAAQAPRRRTTVAFVQLGDGKFRRESGAQHLEQASARAFAASIHHERADLRVRVLDVSTLCDPSSVATAMARELLTSRPFDAVGLDAKLTRRVFRQRLLSPRALSSRGQTWSSQDVVLVTGGAKGITAECALAFGRATGARMVLVGSSSMAPGNDVGQTLQRMQREGVHAEYHRCDLTHAEPVAQLVRLVEKTVGPITGVIHGAGLNSSRRVDQTQPAQAATEMAPKLAGVEHLFAALGARPPKLFVALTSIIGVTGMPGNAWYAFANEALDLRLRHYGTMHPQTQVLSLAFSVWAEVGMGARMGSVEHLAKRGIAPIPVEAGVSHFLRLCFERGADSQVVTTARLGGLDTWIRAETDGASASQTPRRGRFLEETVQWEPGVEAITRCHLSPEKDPYLQHHNYKGSLLFPTVFGLEAMAQTVASLLGLAQLPQVTLEDVELQRPIVVHSEQGAGIEVRALVEESSPDSETTRVRAEIRSEASGYQRPHFEATFVLGRPHVEAVRVPNVTSVLDLDPKTDLYGPLLFQGPLFQQIVGVHALDAQRCVFAVETSQSMPPNLLLGDPYARDALLQGGQLVIPQDLSLPIRVQRWVLQTQPPGPSPRKAVAVLGDRQGAEYDATVHAFDSAGTVVESLVGYRLKVMEHRAELPTAEELAHPARRDETLLRRELVQRADAFGLVAPNLALDYVPGLSTMKKAERHQAEQPIMARAFRAVAPSSSDMPGFSWLESGKPVLTGAATQGQDVSLTHDRHLCLCTVGPGSQGVDLESVVSRTWEEWRTLLGPGRHGLLKHLVYDGDALDTAGARLWTAAEAVRKVTNAPELKLRLQNRQGSSVVFRSAEHDGALHILTFPLRLTWGGLRMLAVVVEKGAPGATTAVFSQRDEVQA